MMDQAANGDGRRWSRWRIAGWGGAASLLLLPFVAMQLGDEVNWDAADFIVMGALLAIAGGAIEFGVGRSRHVAYRAGVAVAVMAGFGLIWVNLAVGILGGEGDPANLMFLGVIAVAVIGAIAARFRPPGMARAMIAAALAQLAVAVIAVSAGLGSPGGKGVYEAVLATGLFGSSWLLAAWLFACAAAAAAASASGPG